MLVNMISSSSIDSFKSESHSDSCLTLCDSMDCIQSMEFSRPEYWSGYPFSSPWDLPKPGIKPRSPALQADSLPTEPQGKPLSLHNALICLLLEILV